MLLLIAIQIVVVGQILVGGEEEAASATGRVADDLIRARLDAIDNGVDQGPRREVLPRALGTFGGALGQQPFVDVES